jgi:hypothetical protein
MAANIYIENIATGSRTRIHPEERGFTVSIREGAAQPFTLESALNDFATIYDRDFEEYYIVPAGNKYILRKSIDTNNINTSELKNYNEANLNPAPRRIFGRLPPGMEGGSRRRKSRKVKRKSKSKSRRRY